jgi:vitamin B12 transporter
MRKKLFGVALLAAFGTLPGPHGEAGAAELLDRSEPYALGEVVVSGTGDGVQASQTVYTVGAEDIRLKGARTLDQAISLLPGVNIRIGGEGVPRVDIRGFKTRHVLLLLDGIPMNSALDQQFDPTSIPTENIAQIKLTAGASSVLYGQGGLGGVINIITRKGSPGVQGMLGLETGDHEPYLARATVSGASERFHYFLSGSATQVDGFPLSTDFQANAKQGSGYRSNSDHERQSLLGTVGFTPNQDLSLGLTVNYTQGSFGKPASVVTSSIDPFAPTVKYQRINDFADLSVQLAAEYAVNRRLSLRGWTYFNHHDSHESQYDDASLASISKSSSFRDHVEASIVGLTLQPRYDLGPAGVLSLSLGAEGDRWHNSDALGVRLVHRDLALYSAGVEYEISPLPGLGLVAGYGHYLQTRSELSQDDYSLLAGASYDILKETRLKASFKRSVRFPALGDLYEIDKGNALLLPEVSYSYEAGVEQVLPLESRLGLTGFYTRARNLIQTDQPTGLSLNVAEVRFAGVELSASTQFVQGLLLRASYAYLHSEDRSRAGRDQLQYTPADKVTLEAKYDFSCGFTPYASLLYVGNQYFYTKNNEVLQKAKLNDYSIVKLKLSQRLLEGRATLYVGADNLFDENYETSYGLPQAGRFIYGGVEWRL